VLGWVLCVVVEVVSTRVPSDIEVILSFVIGKVVDNAFFLPKGAVSNRIAQQ
jgi:hypothetical protein